MTRHPWIASLLVCAALSASLSAQETAPPSAGDQVRVRISGARVDGYYLSGFGETRLAIRGPEGDTVRLAMTEVQSIHVAAGKQRRFMRNLLIGAAIGGAIGVAAGIPGMHEQTISDPVGSLVYTGSAGAIVGGVTGLLVALKPRTRWRQVWPPGA